MAQFQRVAYGSTPVRLQRANRNSDNNWGGYQWPGGVPASLLGSVTIPGGIKVVVRKELAELVALIYEIADRKYGRRFTRGWTGGYMNRPIGGTSSPSNHSRGRAIDNDAQDNPMSRTFICNIPPALIADWESAGWYWGGRYTGTYDPMHVEYVGTPADVAADVTQARRILAAVTRVGEKPSPEPTPAPVPSTPSIPTSEEDELTDEEKARLRNIETILGSLQNAIGDPTNGVFFHAASADAQAAAAKASADNAANISSEVRNWITDPEHGVLHAIESLGK